jgi:hypothetical protein
MLLLRPWLGPCKLLPFQGLAPDNRPVVIPKHISLVSDIGPVPLVSPRLHVPPPDDLGDWLLLQLRCCPYK